MKSFWSMFDFNLNKGWKKGDYYQQRKFDNDFMSVKVPWFEISQFNGNCAIIINGRQLILKKLPKKTEYFVDKDLGIFEINPDKSFFLNKTAVYFYDVRNQNALHPGTLNELYKWANSQGMYKIRRVDLKHARRLSAMDASNGKLLDQMESQKKANRKLMASVLQKVDTENQQKKEAVEKEQGNPNSDEYRLYDENDKCYLITKNLFDNGYIDVEERRNLDHKLTLGHIKTVDDLMKEVDDFSTVFVTKPISHELERILDDFHTYKPRDIVNLIKDLSKIRSGIKKLRTKAVVNWFPSMYILFGALGIGVIYILYEQYSGGGGEFSSIIPGT